MASSSSSTNNVIDITNRGHQFKINYYKTIHLQNGECVSTQTFKTNGYEWAINYYPKGRCSVDNSAYISFYLQLKTKTPEEVKVIVAFEIFGAYFPGLEQKPYRSVHKFGNKNGVEGLCYDMKRSEIVRGYVKDEFIIGACIIEILNKPLDKLPINNTLKDGLYEAYKKEEMIDITFQVEGKNFGAHKLVLASRSPVFKAELYGLMAESKTNHIKINEMNPLVFKHLLHYIYTDMLPNISDKEFFESEYSITNENLINVKQHLLGAADRYQIEGLKSVCEDELCDLVSLDNVLSCLDLADRHNCVLLKEKCLEFVTEPDNFMEISLSNGYIQLMQSSPNLLVELRERATGSSAFKNVGRKKPKIERND